jgi:hypothetical protein
MTCCWHWRVGLIALSLACAAPRAARADEPSLADLERTFHSLPMEARRLTGPLFWLHGDESKAQLELELQKVADGGNGTFTAESRPHSDWLGEGWFRDLGICLDAAKRLDLTMWIFDEKWWPSGEVGGKVPPQFGSKYLEVEVRPVEGAVNLDGASWPKRLVAVLAGRDTGHGIDGSSLMNLGNREDLHTRRWPEGKWSLLLFYWRPSDGRGGRLLVDGASKDAIAWYIKTVYQPHYDRFPADFGKTIKGYFYDEPETPGDWGTEVIPELRSRGVDWKKALVAHKLKLADPEEQTAASYQYRLAFAEAWGRTMYGNLARWCAAHHVKSMGHWLEHSHEYIHDRECAGDMFQLQKYSDMGAIDAVFKQFAPGKRDDTYVTPKLGSSITHAYGKPDDVTMVEIFGARGQDLTYPEMKWWTDVMQVAGVNFLIPHSFNPRAPHDTDCPPYFYNGGHEPRYPLYRVFADYTSRLSLLLSGGRHVCPVALLYAGQGYHFKPAVTPEDMTVALQDALYDSDWIPYDVFENDMKVDATAKTLALREERYRVLVVPPVDVMPYSALQKIRTFFEQGGIVVGYGFLPTKSATLGHTAKDVAAVREAVWGSEASPSLGVRKTSPAGGRSYLLPEKPTAEQLQLVLAGDAGVRPTLEVTAGQTNHWLHVLHRVKSGRDVFLVANLNHEGEPRSFRFRMTADGVPECWDAVRNEITSVPFRRDGKTVELGLTLEPLESVVLVFGPEPRVLPTRIEGTPRALRPPLAVVREAAPPTTAPAPPEEKAAELEGCSWVWYPEKGDPAVAAPPGERFFRKTVRLPEGTKVTKAIALLSADNGFVLSANGTKTGESGMGEGDWSRPSRIDLSARLHPGDNVLAIVATNGSDRPNPAGLIGKLVVELEGKGPLTVLVDETWKVSDRPETGWTDAGFDDTKWKPSRKVAPFGGGPWKRGAGDRLTLSPVKADPFVGHVDVPSDLDSSHARLVLELEALAPEEAARVTVNGVYAGGFIGRPLRLDLSSALKPGTNRLLIEPFAPRAARVAVLPR